MVITSPPYANRYDYTRTYALELAWLGFDRDRFAELRQQMLSATVENKTKLAWLRQLYDESPELLDDAIGMYQGQDAVHEVLAILREHADDLGNRHVIRLLEGYFLEMAIVVAELGRVTRTGGTVIMVNDNVQYHGEEAPVDLILSDFAEQSGFVCKNIWMLPRGKGNSSQQMAASAGERSGSVSTGGYAGNRPRRRAAQVNADVGEDPSTDGPSSTGVDRWLHGRTELPSVGRSDD